MPQRRISKRRLVLVTARSSCLDGLIPKIAVPLAKLAVTAGSNIYNDWQQDTINENAVADLRKRQRSAGLAGLLGAASHLKPEQGSEYDGYREALTEYNRRGTEIQLDRVRGAGIGHSR